VGDDSYLVFRQKLLGEDGSLRRERCHGEAARPALAKVRGDVLIRFHAVAEKRRSRTRNSQFSLLVPELRATTTAVQMAAPVRSILDTTWHIVISTYLASCFGSS
jgi:hypothetical protein